MKKKIMWKKVLGLSLAFAMCAGIGVGMMDTGRITASADEYKRTLAYNINVPEDTTWPSDGTYAEDTNLEDDVYIGTVGERPNPDTLTASDGSVYNFQGWKANDEGDVLQEGDEVMFLENASEDQKIILYAQWGASRQLVTVKFVDENGNEVKDSEQLIYVNQGVEYDASEYVKKIPEGYKQNGDIKGDIKGTANDDITITVPVTEAVTALEITVNGNTATLQYNGKEQSVSGYTLSVKDKDGNVIELPKGLEVKPAGSEFVAKGTEISDKPYWMNMDKDSVSFELEGEKASEYKATFIVNDGWLKITKNRALEIKAEDMSVAYNGKEQAAKVEVKAGGEKTDKAKVEITYKDADGKTMDKAPVNVGTYKAEIKASMDEYDSAETSMTIIIKKAPLTVKTEGATKVYDGKALTSKKATLSGLADGDKATVEATGSQTEVGTSKNTYKITWGDNTKESNYEIKEELGELKVTDKKTTTTTTNKTDKDKGSVSGNSLTSTNGETVKTGENDFIIVAVISVMIIAGAGYFLYRKKFQKQ